MARIITFLTRTRGNPDTAEKFGIADFLAYGYLLLGILIILVPVLWTFLSSIKPERAIDSFDTRLLPIAQVDAEIEGIGAKPIWKYKAEDGTVTDVFKAGPTRKMTDVAPVTDPDGVIKVERKRLEPSEELRLATENYLDPLLKRKEQENFHFSTYLFNSVFNPLVDHSGFIVLRRLELWHIRFTLGRDHSSRGYPHRGFPAAPVHAEHSR